MPTLEFEAESLLHLKLCSFLFVCLFVLISPGFILDVFSGFVFSKSTLLALGPTLLAVGTGLFRNFSFCFTGKPLRNERSSHQNVLRAPPASGSLAIFMLKTGVLGCLAGSVGRACDS